MPTETITIQLDRQQIDEIAREVQRQAFRCGECKFFTPLGRYHPDWGTCHKLTLAGLVLVPEEQAGSCPQPMPSVHQDFGCNRFEEVNPHDEDQSETR